MSKRKFVLFAAVLVMCMLLTACGSKPTEEQLEVLCRKWYMLDSVPGVDVEPLLVFNQDGTCAAGKSSDLTWSASTVKGDDLALDVVIKRGKETIYSFYLLIEGYYGQPKAELSDPKRNDYYATYFPLSGDIGLEWQERVYTQWHPSGDNGNIMPLEIRADGTAVVDGVECVWGLDTTWCFDRPAVSIRILTEEEHLYNATIEQNSSGLLCLELMRQRITAHGTTYETVDTYFPSRLMAKIGGRQWTAFNSKNSITEVLHVNRDHIYAIEISGYKLYGSVHLELMDDQSDDKIVFAIPNVKEPEYMVTITENGEYPNLMIEDMTTGEIVNYYDSGIGYDPNNPEVDYYKAVNVLEYNLDKSSFYDGSQDLWIRQEEMLPYAYTLLQNVAEHRDAQAYLDRFIVLPDHLVEIERTTTDRVGNQAVRSYASYQYDAAGRYTQVMDEDIAIAWGLSYDDSRYHYLYNIKPAYDETGRMIEYVVTSGSTSIVARAILSYDADGKLVSAQIQNNSSDSCSTMSYDEHGNLILVDGDNFKCVYEYDENGRLIHRNLEERQFEIDSAYTYEGEDLIQRVDTHTKSKKTWTVTWNYSYDEQGRISSASVASTHPEYDYNSEIYTYIYENIYFYNVDQNAVG